MSRVRILKELIEKLDEGDPIRISHEVGEDVEVTLGTFVRTELRDAEWAERAGAVRIRTIVVDGEYPTGTELRKYIPFVTVTKIERRW